MLEDLSPGDQIWVYHDGDLAPNLISRINPYCHVMVYIGKTDGGIHEVVHAQKDNSGCHGCCMAKIVQEDAMKAIKSEHFIFLGHQIKGVQFASNFNEIIRERALACVGTIFDYDHR